MQTYLLSKLVTGMLVKLKLASRLQTGVGKKSMLMKARPTGTAQPKESSMTDHVYKSIELTGSSNVSIEDAVIKAIAKASETWRNIQWFNVIEPEDKYMTARWPIGKSR